MAQNSTVKTTGAGILSAQKLDNQRLEAKSETAPVNPITVEQANAIASALRPNTGLSNPVAEVQAKLRAAMEATPQPSKVQDTAFVTLLISACAFMTLLGIVVGIVCVLFGAAMFLFPVSAGTALGAFVIAAGSLFYFVFTRGVMQKSAKPSDTFEPLAIGRLSATWGS